MTISTDISFSVSAQNLFYLEIKSHKALQTKLMDSRPLGQADNCHIYIGENVVASDTLRKKAKQIIMVCC